MKFNKKKITSIAEKYKLQLIILFGSQARNESTLRSDVDIAVVAEDGESAKEAKNFLSLVSDLQTSFMEQGNDIDLLLLNSASAFLKYQVAMEGIALYEQSEDLFLEFAIRAMKEYEDVRHFDKYYQEIVQDFLKEHHDK